MAEVQALAGPAVAVSVSSVDLGARLAPLVAAFNGSSKSSQEQRRVVIRLLLRIVCKIVDTDHTNAVDQQKVRTLKAEILHDKLAAVDGAISLLTDALGFQLNATGDKYVLPNSTDISQPWAVVQQLIALDNADGYFTQFKLHSPEYMSVSELEDYLKSENIDSKDCCGMKMKLIEKVKAAVLVQDQNSTAASAKLPSRAMVKPDDLHLDPEQQSPYVGRAVVLMRSGQTVQAVSLMQQVYEQAQREHGVHSISSFRACRELGALLTLVGKEAEGAAMLVQACRIDLGPWTTKPFQKTKLINFSEAAEAMCHLGDLETAEALMREAVAGRIEFYGKQHAGYGFGLESLAGVLLKRKKYEEAITTVNATISNFIATNHPRLANACALKAKIMAMATVRGGRPLGDGGGGGRAAAAPAAAAGPEDGGLFAQLPPELYLETWSEVADGWEKADGEVLRLILRDFVAFGKLYGLDESCPKVYEQALVLTANNEANLQGRGDGDVRLAALHEIMDRQRAAGDSAAVSHTLNGLGMAASEYNKFDEADQYYRDAIALAQVLKDDAMLSIGQRNYGCFLKTDIKDMGKAEEVLRDAIASAQLVKDPAKHKKLVGAAQAALGILLQHLGPDRLDDAKPLLELALTNLGPADRDAVFARSHLRAIGNSGREQHSNGSSSKKKDTAIDAATPVVRAKGHVVSPTFRVPFCVHSSDTKKSCGCGDSDDMLKSLNDVLQGFVKKQLPPAIWNKVEVELKAEQGGEVVGGSSSSGADDEDKDKDDQHGGHGHSHGAGHGGKKNPGVFVTLKAPLSDDEQQTLSTVVEHATHQFFQYVGNLSSKAAWGGESDDHGAIDKTE